MAAVCPLRPEKYLPVTLSGWSTSEFSVSSAWGVRTGSRPQIWLILRREPSWLLHQGCGGWCALGGNFGSDVISGGGSEALVLDDGRLAGFIWRGQSRSRGRRPVTPSTAKRAA
jgi:hypothetical protein